MEQGKEYYAFISYSHKDEEWAKWLQHEFEHYHLPATLNGLTDVPDKFRPIFRDIDELSGGELKPQITHALEESSYLVIVCSRSSAKSPYVNGEIKEFIDIGRKSGVDHVHNIFPFIIEGVPHSKDNPDNECFPEALRNLPSELIAGDATKHGREHAFVKILSGTLQHAQIRFSMLWNQFERDRIETERREREKRDRLLLLESRFLSEKALDIASTDSRLARMLVLKALPKKLDDPDERPYCPEAESALRRICLHKSTIFEGHEKGVTSFELSSSGDKAVSASLDGTVRIWDVNTGLQIGTPLTGHGKGVLHAVFSHQGMFIASCSMDGSVILWDAGTGMKVGAPIYLHEAYAKHLAFTHDDRFLIALSSDEYLRIWNVEDRRLVRTIHISESNGMAVDRKDRWVAVAGCTHFSIEIYDLKTAERIMSIPSAHTESLIGVNFSPDGKRLLSNSFDGKFKVWDWLKGEEILARNVGWIQGAYAPVVNDARFSQDGKSIVTASQDHMIRIWDAESGQQKDNMLIGHTNSVSFACFSSDGSFVASASLDGTARIWDLHPRVPYRIMGRAMNIPFESKRVTSWRQTGVKVEGHTVSPHQADVSPDGRLLVTASTKELKVWDVRSHLQLGPDLTCFDDFYDVLFTDDGRGIVTETRDDHDVLFDWKPLQELIDETREQVKNRQFTDAEIKRYYLE